MVSQSSVIPEIKIIEQIVKANNDIKKIEEGNKPESIIIKIDSLLPPYVEFIRQRKILKQNFIEAKPNRQKIANLINKWIGYRAYLNA